MKNNNKLVYRIFSTSWLPIVFFLSLLFVTACEKWDLETTDFVEVFTLENITEGENSTEVIVAGEIKGLVSDNSVDQHGHVWSSKIDTPTLTNKDDQTTFLKRDNSEFSSRLENLSTNTLYYYRAYAIYEEQVFYGTVRSFMTGALSINAVVDSTFNQIRFSDGFQMEAAISISGIEQGVSVTDYGVIWDIEPEVNFEKDRFVLVSKGSTIADGNPIIFSDFLTELQPSFEYYIRPYLIIGGITFYGEEVSFHIGDVWIRKEAFPGERRSYPFAFSIDDKGYICSGNGLFVASDDTWEYNSHLDTWEKKADFVGLPRGEGVSFSINGKGYIATGKSFGDIPETDFWEYDPQENLWEQKATFDGEPRLGAAGFSIGGKGYIGTGTNVFDDQLNDFWEYDPVENQWTRKADFGGERRRNAVGFSINDKGYIGTGYYTDANSYFYLLNDFWEYDPTTNQWVRKADFGGEPRRYSTSFTINDKGYIGCGDDLDLPYFMDFWEYDPRLDKWTKKADFEGGPRTRAVGFSANNKGYLSMGQFQAFQVGDLWEYIPR